LIPSNRFIFSSVNSMKIATLDLRLLKMAVGLALETAIVQRRETRELTALYSDPDRRKIAKLHGRLIDSDDSYEREVAIWLELALEAPPLKSDPQKLAAEMREFESVLYTLISRMGSFETELNHWMNFVANAAQYIQDGYWIDAKIMLSRAVYISKATAVEKIKSTPEYSYEIDVLQKATVSYFDDMKGYPLELKIPEGSLEPVVAVQEVMLDMMREYYDGGHGEEEASRQAIQRLSSVIRHLMEDNSGKAEQELRLASTYMEEGVGEESMEGHRNRLGKAIALMSSDDE
jgi:hypothetical protein